MSSVSVVARTVVPFAATLADFGDRPALVTAEGIVSYRDLARRADEIGDRLGVQRRLVLLRAANDVDTVAAYLAALRGGHPVLLVGRGSPAVETMIETFEPDVVVDGAEVVSRRPDSAHDLHADLAVLLSTSGSTGSAKLVRLSHENLQSNAEAIASYLDIHPDDRAATTLPLHYCYGLSVLHSHLVRGASVILTELSVADDAFWELFRRERGTSFAAVPYTFDLLDRVGFADLELPDLRYVTQAGGRLEPQRVRRYAQFGAHRGFDLFVMYGQTEATARMAYLPPHLAASAPDAVGIPIPGGSLRLAADGELVYSGPNVMLGYAHGPDDLTLGRTVTELPTGDLARIGDDGLFRIVGRTNRFLKLFGLRIDLAQLESRLAARDITAYCTGDDRVLVVAVEGSRHDPALVRREVSAATGLPPAAVQVRAYAEIPRLSSGKPDYTAIAAGPPPAPIPRQRAARGQVGPVAALVEIYATVLDRTDVTPDRSFVDLGGDSLSYVEASIRLEQVLGQLPADWHVTPIADLVARSPASAPTAGPAAESAVGPRRRRRWRMLDTSVLLRALAIVLVVGTHVHLFVIPGGAHTLLGVAGYNFARFQLTGAGRLKRARGIARRVGRIVVASVVWITLALLVTDQYTLANVFLVNNVVGTDEARFTWHFWYIEDLVYIVVAVTALLSLGFVDRWERRWPFVAPLVVMVLGLVARYQVVPGIELHKTVANVWLFAIGWAAAKASTRSQRLLLTAATVATVPGFFGSPLREAVIVAGLALLIWVPAVPVTRLVTVVAGTLASASLYIYLVHWQVYVHIWDYSKPLAVVASLAAGIAYAAVFGWVTRRVVAVARRVGRAGLRTEAVLN